MRLSYANADRKGTYSDRFDLDCRSIYLETQANPGSTNNPDERQSKAIEAVAWELWAGER